LFFVHGLTQKFWYRYIIRHNYTNKIITYIYKLIYHNSYWQVKSIHIEEKLVIFLKSLSKKGNLFINTENNILYIPTYIYTSTIEPKQYIMMINNIDACIITCKLYVINYYNNKLKKYRYIMIIWHYRIINNKWDLKLQKCSLASIHFSSI